jgi:2,4-dienoyl-CoA reductase (NADPH2)
VVVDDGTGFWHACSAAESLCERGLRVVLATPANGIGLRIPPESLRPLYERLASQSVRFEPFTQLEAVDAAGATLLHTLSGKRTHEPADTVVVHAGQQAEDALVRDLVAATFPVHAIGDCVAPRLLTQAIYEAGEAARRLARPDAIGA